MFSFIECKVPLSADFVGCRASNDVTFERGYGRKTALYHSTVWLFPLGHQGTVWADRAFIGGEN